MLAQLLPQHLHLAQRVQAFDDLLEEDLQPLRLDGFGQIVVRPFLDGLDSGFDGALGGQNDHRVVPAVVLERAKQLEASHARHDQVADDDGRAGKA
jgi:hypothetical protein